jgi:hypothetical protein
MQHASVCCSRLDRAQVLSCAAYRRTVCARAMVPPRAYMLARHLPPHLLHHPTRHHDESVQPSLAQTLKPHGTVHGWLHAPCRTVGSRGCRAAGVTASEPRASAAEQTGLPLPLIGACTGVRRSYVMLPARSFALMFTPSSSASWDLCVTLCFRAHRHAAGLPRPRYAACAVLHVFRGNTKCRRRGHVQQKDAGALLLA